MFRFFDGLRHLGSGRESFRDGFNRGYFQNFLGRSFRATPRNSAPAPSAAGDPLVVRVRGGLGACTAVDPLLVTVDGGFFDGVRWLDLDHLRNALGGSFRFGGGFRLGRSFGDQIGRN